MGRRSAKGELAVTPGDPWPPGVHECCDGVNIAVFSRHATRMAVLLYDNNSGDGTPVQKINLDRHRHRTGDMWHVRLGG